LNDISLSNTKKKIAVFASGKGSNAENLIKHFNNSTSASVDLVLSNNANAAVIGRAKNLGVETFVFDKNELNNSFIVIDKLKDSQIDWIVLAGFLLKFPENILKEFSGRVVNIHPALLPKYGGKGMYGMNVHKAVVENKEKETGITIHFVNENYDEGEIIFQARIEVLSSDTAETVATEISLLEQKYFPKIIENLILTNNNSPSFGGG
jgi:phosphoribosylglycinamide formyltransferase-1